MRLIWLSKIESGSTTTPDVDLSHAANRDLGVPLGSADGIPEALVVNERLELLQLGKIRDPAVADGLGDDPGKGRVGQQQPTPWGHAVGLVAEALRKHVGEVLDRHRAQQVGMDRGDAVRAVRADDGEIGHPDLADRAPSSIRLTRSTRPSSPGKRARTSSIRRRSISRMISRWRGSSSSNHRTGHFSNASGSSVWFV